MQGGRGGQLGPVGIENAIAETLGMEYTRKRAEDTEVAWVWS